MIPVFWKRSCDRLKHDTKSISRVSTTAQSHDSPPQSGESLPLQVSLQLQSLSLGKLTGLNLVLLCVLCVHLHLGQRKKKTRLYNVNTQPLTCLDKDEELLEKFDVTTGK